MSFKMNTSSSSGVPVWAPVTAAEGRTYRTIDEWIHDYITSTTARDDTGSPRFPGNWPPSAEFAVEYSTHDRQFPSVIHPITVIFFDTETEYNSWLDEKREWVRGTDFDFSVSINWYRWDLGPELLTSFDI